MPNHPAATKISHPVEKEISSPIPIDANYFDSRDGPTLFVCAAQRYNLQLVDC